MTTLATDKNRDGLRRHHGQPRSSAVWIGQPQFIVIDTYNAPPTDVATLNKYLYADDNPILGVDPSGWSTIYDPDFGADNSSMTGMPGMPPQTQPSPYTTIDGIDNPLVPSLSNLKETNPGSINGNALHIAANGINGTLELRTGVNIASTTDKTIAVNGMTAISYSGNNVNNIGFVQFDSWYACYGIGNSVIPGKGTFIRDRHGNVTYVTSSITARHWMIDTGYSAKGFKGAYFGGTTQTRNNTSLVIYDKPYVEEKSLPTLLGMQGTILPTPIYWVAVSQFYQTYLVYNERPIAVISWEVDNVWLRPQNPKDYKGDDSFVPSKARLICIEPVNSFVDPAQEDLVQNCGFP